MKTGELDLLGEVPHSGPAGQPASAKCCRGAANNQGRLSLRSPEDTCPQHCQAQAGPALLLGAAHVCTTITEVEPMWPLPLWVAASKLKFVQGACDPQSLSYMLASSCNGGWGSLFLSFTLGRCCPIKWGFLPTQAGWSKELSVNKNDSCPPWGCHNEVLCSLGKQNIALLLPISLQWGQRKCTNRNIGYDSATCPSAINQSQKPSHLPSEPGIC